MRVNLQNDRPVYKFVDQSIESSINLQNCQSFFKFKINKNVNQFAKSKIISIEN